MLFVVDRLAVQGRVAGDSLIDALERSIRDWRLRREQVAFQVRTISSCQSLIFNLKIDNLFLDAALMTRLLLIIPFMLRLRQLCCREILHGKERCITVQDKTGGHAAIRPALLARKTVRAHHH